MEYEHNIQQAAEYAQTALSRLKKEKLAPTPDNFTLWYIYYSGQSPELTRAIDILVSNGQTLTEGRCYELYQRFLSENSDEERIRRAGTRIQDTIKNVSGAVLNVKTATSQYGGTLDDINEKVNNVKNTDELKGILSSIMEDTQVMIEHNHKLEEQLDMSSMVMEELERDLESIRKEALTDGLTGLANRKAFDEALRHVAEESEESQSTFSLVMLDIDHFKGFNDNFGHQIGDQVLRLVAKTLVDGVKGRDTAARYGGEEFAIILPDTHLTAAVVVSNALRQAVASKDVVNRNTGEKLSRITLSAGAAEFIPGETLSDLIERSDSALYTAKHNGRNQVAAAPTPAQKKQKETG